MTRDKVSTDVEVNGSSLQALLDAMGYLKLKARQILASRGIEPLDPNSWYPMPAVVECYHDILKQVGPSTMRAIGRYIPKRAAFPPAIDSFESALQLLDQAYRMNHRGSGDIGSYLYHAEGLRAGRVFCDNPYPCEFDQGIIEALHARFPPADSFVLRLDHEGSGCRHKGAPACTYRLRW